MPKRQSLSPNQEGLSGESQTLAGAREGGDWKISAFAAFVSTLQYFADLLMEL